MSEETKVLPAPNEKTTPSKSGFLFVLLLLAALACAGAYGGYWLWQQSSQYGEQLKNSTQSVEKQTASILALKQQITALESELTSLRQSLTQTEEIAQTSIQALSNEFKLIKGSSRKDWLLAEAEYLLRIANQRLMIERDIKSSLSLLQAADGVLSEIADPSLMPVRMKIAEDMFTLRASADSQVEEHAIILTALSSSVATLQLQQDIRLSQSNSEATSDQSSDSTLQRILDKLKSALVKAVRIQRAEERYEAPPTPEYSAYLTQNLGLRIEQARLFLLRGQYDQYQAQLNSSLEWMQAQFPSNNHHVDVIKEQLATLLTALPQKHSVDISGSLTTLQEIIERKYLNQELGKHQSAEDKASGDAQ